MELNEIIQKDKELRVSAMFGSDIFMDDGGELAHWASEGDPESGYLPAWASDAPMDDSENNPYKPFTFSFDNQHLIAHRVNTFPLLVEKIEQQNKEIESLKKALDQAIERSGAHLVIGDHPTMIQFSRPEDLGDFV